MPLDEEEQASIDVRHLREIVSNIPPDIPVARTLVPQSSPPPDSILAPTQIVATQYTATQKSQTDDVRIPESPTFRLLSQYETVDTYQIPNHAGSVHLTYSGPSPTQERTQNRRQLTTQPDSTDLPQTNHRNPISIQESLEKSKSSPDVEAAPSSGQKPLESPPPPPQSQSSKSPRETAQEKEANTVADLLLEEEDSGDRPDYFPEELRYETEAIDQPNPESSPVKNPLSHLGVGRGTGLTLSQVFGAPSSPVVRTRQRLDSQPPPTPSFNAARMMAQSMAPLVRSTSDSYNSPVDRRRSVPDLPDTFMTPVKKGVMEVNFAGPSPLPASSPPRVTHIKPAQDIDSDSDDQIGDVQPSFNIKRKVQFERNSGTKTPNHLSPLPKAISNPTKKSIQKPKKTTKARERSSTSAVQTQPPEPIPDDDETSDEAGDVNTRDIEKMQIDIPTPRPIATISKPSYTQVPASPNIITKPRRPVISSTQVPASPNIITKSTRSPLSSFDFDDDSWSRPKLPVRRTKSSSSSSFSSLRKTHVSASIHQIHSMTQIPQPPPEVVGTSDNPASLANMPPFNIPPLSPTTQGRNNSIPEFVRETSGLVPETSQAPMLDDSSPNQSRKSSLEEDINPGGENEKAILSDKLDASAEIGRKRNTNMPPPPVTPGPSENPRKRQRQDSGKESGDLRSFASLESSQPLLSSQEEPDEIDMFDIMNSVGVGDRPDLDMPAPVIPTSVGRTNKRRKTKDVKTVGVARFADETKEISSARMVSPVSEEQTYVPTQPETEPQLPLEEPELPPSLPPPAPSEVTAETQPSITLAPEPTSQAKPKSKPGRSSRPSSSHASPAIPKKPTTKASRVSQRHSLATASTSSVLSSSDDSSDILSTTNPAYSIPGSTTKQKSLSAPWRVFALFKDKNLNYHPATVLESDSRQVKVEFDDGTILNLGRECVRTLDLRVGDLVRVDLQEMRKITYVIKDFPPSVPVDENENEDQNANENPPVTPAGKQKSTQHQAKHTDARGRTHVSLVPKNDPDATPIDVAVTNLYLIKSLWSQFSDRDTSTKTLNLSFTSAYNYLQTAISPSVAITTPSSAITTPSTHRRITTPLQHQSQPAPQTYPPPAPIFTNMIFTLTGPQKSAHLSSLILSRGGTILSSGFTELFHELPDSNPILSLKPPYETIPFVAVISHSYTRTAKYLQALALGIPCLSEAWIEDCVKQEQVLEWEFYLLPAGETKRLGGQARSQVLWPPSGEVGVGQLVGDGGFKNRLEKRRKVIDGWRVLVMVKGLSTEQRGAYPFLLLALGAGKVEVVKGVEQLERMLKVESWDCVFCKEAEKNRVAKMGIRVVDDNELKDAVVFGRLD
ncbi:hypothetical protein BZA77DRAFT_345721 [Pyronema omphalodes]|nr:hypothetical protein BZA77DRAFT_345721 [Pyronema omphalodes]